MKMLNDKLLRFIAGGTDTQPDNCMFGFDPVKPESDSKNVPGGNEDICRPTKNS